jgi:hypothetical protein
MESKHKNIYAALILGSSFVIAGFFISQTLIKAKQMERYVTVKGLSEREVEANLAIWPIQLSVASNDLVQLENDLQKQTNTINKFFMERGFTDEEISAGSPSIQDVRANLYGGNQGTQPYRYIAKTDFTIRTSDLIKLQEAVEDISSIIGQGIILGSKNYWQQIEYLYTDLNSIKPDMIEEATHNAREAAEKFARDSGSKVGKIKSASQGLFTIQDRDVNTGHIKKVRVVNTVVFYLED